MRSVLGLSLAVALLPAVPARADIISLQPTRDNTIYEDPFGLLSNGQGPYLFAGATVHGTLRRGLIAFDPGAIPAGSTIVRAELILHMSRTITTAEPVTLNRALVSWGEGASFALGEGGQGAPAEPGDATWLSRFHPDLPWSSPGGDFDPDASANTLVSGNGYYSWTGLAPDLQRWLDHPASNLGWFILGNEGAPASAKRFDTREHTDPDLRPQLIVEYLVPAPPTIALALLPLLLGRRRDSALIAGSGSDSLQSACRGGVERFNRRGNCGRTQGNGDP